MSQPVDLGDRTTQLSPVVIARLAALVELSAQAFPGVRVGDDPADAGRGFRRTRRVVKRAGQ